MKHQTSEIETLWPIALLAIKFIVAFYLCKRSSIVIRHGEIGILERFGSFNRILLPGMHFVIPFIDNLREVKWQVTSESPGGIVSRHIQRLDRLDTRETLYDFPAQTVITKDNVTISIDALLYYQVIDAKAAVYNVSNLPHAIEKLAQTALRNVLGSMNLDETLASRDRINKSICDALNGNLEKWGARVTMVEVQEISPPKEIKQAMEMQMKAERSCRAAIVDAEGKRNAAILKAEGEKNAKIMESEAEKISSVMKAQGEAEVKRLMIQAEVDSIKAIKEALAGKNPIEYMLANSYMKMMAEIGRTGSSKVIVVPYEASMLMGALAPVKEMFNGMIENNSGSSKSPAIDEEILVTSRA
jgi:regulator of protease activity HflC (stomatin/prohibitin superfamily)